MKIFITGGTGFLGSHIVMQLLEQGHEVTVLARDLNRVTGYNGLNGLKLVKGLITDFEKFPYWLKGQDVLIHTVLNWGESASEMILNDMLPAVKLFETAAQVGVQQGIFTSSTMALGEYRHDMHEEMPKKPLDFYGADKASIENFLFGISRKYPMRCNIVRPGRIIGRRVVENGKDWTFEAVPQLAGLVKSVKEIRVMKNDGTQLIYGGDLAKIFVALVNSDKNREIYFGVGKLFIDKEAIARKILELTNSKNKIIVEENPYEDRPKMFDAGKIERDFGFSFDTWPEILEEIKNEI